MRERTLRQTLSRSARAQRLWRAASAAKLVRESARFFARELRRRRSTSTYRLRESGLRAVVRHPLVDAWVLEEIFGHRAYDPPAEVPAVLPRPGEGLRIVDLGGNIGLFGLWALGRWPCARLVSYEPDPSNAEVLRRTVYENGFESRWTVVEAAAGVTDGPVEFLSDFQISQLPFAGQDPAARLRPFEGKFPFIRESPLYKPRRITVEQRDVLPSLRNADLVKIDIEGGEWTILQDSRFGEITAQALVLEYHPELTSDPAPARIIREALSSAGLQSARTLGDPLSLGTVWAWRA